LSYYLIKIVPFWGLTLISASVLFLSPLIYKTNKELIDHHVNNASNIINQQTEQVKQLASHHAARATETTKQYVGDYSAKAQDLIGSRSRSVSPTITTKSEPAPVKKENVPTQYKSEDFPAAPKEEFKSAPTTESVASGPRDLSSEEEPLIST
jgi:hypothetical protein